MFDGVWLCAVLLHVRRGAAHHALRESRRVLRDGGIAFVSVQSGTGDEWRRHDEGWRYIARYTCEGLSDQVQRAGFDLLDTTATTDDRGVSWVSVLAARTNETDHA